MTAKEIIYWHKGLSWDTVSSLQQPGFLKSCQNISLEVEGKGTLRQRFANINSTATGAQHSIRKFRDILVVGDGVNLRANDDSGNFTTLYSSLSGDIISFRPYKDFLCGVNGTDFFLVDPDKNLYPARIANPATAPTLADAGSGAGPSGNYMGYVTYFITWPNGHTYETGLSPASANVNLTDNSIAWTAIPVCPYAAYYGTAPTIYRKLYRGPGTGGTLGDIYFVATIANNTATTYTDSISDAVLATADASYVDDYDQPPIPNYIEFHYGRAFMIDASNPHRMYWTEAASGVTAAENEVLFPLATLGESWDDLRVSGFDYVDPQGLVSWGVNLYIPLKNTWIRKQGNDPDTWSYKKTYAKHGIGAPHTLDFSSSPAGIIGVSNPEAGEPGLSIFGGQSTDIIASPRLDYVFKEHMNLNAIAKCRGKMAGKTYHLLYPSGSASEPDTHLAIDMHRYPDIRVAEWTDLNGMSLETDSQGKKFYIGTSAGYAKTQSSAGTCDVLLETHDLIGGDPKLFNEQKTVKELKYSLKGTVTMEIYVDGELLKWPDDSTSLTFTGTDETIQVKKLPQNFKGYKFSVKITGTGLSEFEIYSPWQLLFDVIG